MKRSTTLRLTLMAAVPVLAGCESQPTGALMASVSECTGVHKLSIAECKTAYENALAEHARLAPRFEQWGECNDQFGACQSITADGASWWIPPMAGFLVGYAVSRHDDDVGSGGGSGGYLYRYGGSQPLYRERRGDYLNPRGDYVGDRSGPVTGKQGAINPPVRAITISRAGFGSTSSARSSFGSRGFGS